MNKKQKAVLLFILFCSFCSKAEEDISFNVASIPFVSNIDSLENYVISCKQLNIKQYLKYLIIIEKNNFYDRYEKSGNQLLEIFCLATLLQDERAIALYNYYYSEFYYSNSKKFDILAAYKQLLTALEQFQKLDDTLGIAMCYKLIIWRHGVNDKLVVKDKIEEYVNEADKILKETNDMDVRLCILQMKAKYYEKDKQMQEYEKTIAELVRFLELRKEKLFHRTNFYMNVSWVYYLNGDIDKSYQYLLKGKYGRKSKFQSIIFHLNLGEILLRKKEYIEARKNFELVKKTIYSFPNKYFYLYDELYFHYSQCLASMGYYKIALNYRDSAQYYNQKQIQKRENDDLESHLYRIKQEYNQKEIDFLKKESNLYQVIVLILLSAILIIVLLNVRVKMLKKRMEKLNSFLFRLITVISHDIKSPLLSTNGLTGLIRGVLDKKKYDQCPEIVHSIEKTNIEVLNIINNILSWIKMNNTEQCAKTELFSVDNLLRELSLLYKHQATLHHTEIIVEADRSFRLETNREALSIILRNAIDNAIKNSQKEPVVIQVKEDNTSCILYIKNRSTIKVAKLQKILNAMNQKNEDQNTIGFGIELMAFFSKQINVHIDIESTVEVGTIVKISIPR